MQKGILVNEYTWTTDFSWKKLCPGVYGYTRKIKFKLRDYVLDISKSTMISDQPFIDSAIDFILGSLGGRSFPLKKPRKNKIFIALSNELLITGHSLIWNV